MSSPPDNEQCPRLATGAPIDREDGDTHVPTRPPFDRQAVLRRRRVAHELDAILKMHRYRARGRWSA